MNSDAVTDGEGGDAVLLLLQENVHVADTLWLKDVLGVWEKVVVGVRVWVSVGDTVGVAVSEREWEWVPDLLYV